MTDREARVLLESWRWPNGPQCPFCDAVDPYKVTPYHATDSMRKKSSTREGVYICQLCRKQFTVTVKTALSKNHLGPARVVRMCLWFRQHPYRSILRLCKAEGIQYKSAHRFRRKVWDREPWLQGKPVNQREANPWQRAKRTLGQLKKHLSPSHSRTRVSTPEPSSPAS